MYDVIIIGGGPAGLSAALTAQSLALDYVVLERGLIADTVYHFPVARKLFSTANELELRPGDLDGAHKPTREELLDYYYDVVIREGLNIRPGVEVQKIESAGDYLTILSKAGVFNSRAAVVAVGGFGKQRRLGAAGENPATVSYRFTETYPYSTRPVLVVGGGNSAAEAALAEAGARVTLSVRRSSLDLPPSQGDGALQAAQIKAWVRAPLDEAIAAQRIRLVLSSAVVEVGSGSAVIEYPDRSGRLRQERVDCDHVFALIGADPDTWLLSGAGAEIAEDGRPVYNPETYETTVPGLYLAGHLTRDRHIRNAIAVGRKVANKVGAKIAEMHGVR